MLNNYYIICRPNIGYLTATLTWSNDRNDAAVVNYDEARELLAKVRRGFITPA